MKVAVLISGQMRDYKVNVQNHIKSLIEPNNADVFVYACNKNTMHTVGQNITQKYNVTSVKSSKELEDEIKNQYGKFLKNVIICSNESLIDNNFGTIGYFKRRINNQMSNVKSCFNMAINYSKEKGFEYDIIVRCRPDNSIFPEIVHLSKYEIKNNTIYSTIFPGGHRDPWFFSFANPESFKKYCSFVYLENIDEERKDNNFICPETALENFIYKIGNKIILIQNICRPFYGYDKTKKIVNFPYINLEEKLINSKGKWVEINL